MPHLSEGCKKIVVANAVLLGLLVWLFSVFQSIAESCGDIWSSYLLPSMEKITSEVFFIGKSCRFQ